MVKNDRQVIVRLGNSLIPHDRQTREPGDQWPEPKWHFHRMLSNPPFGVTWGGKDGYEKEARKLEKTRYKAGIPRVLPKGSVIMASRATIGSVRIAGTELTTNQGFISFVCYHKRLH